MEPGAYTLEQIVISQDSRALSSRQAFTFGLAPLPHGNHLDIYPYTVAMTDA